MENIIHLIQGGKTPADTVSNVSSGFGVVFEAIRKIYYLIYNAIAEFRGKPTTTY